MKDYIVIWLFNGGVIQRADGGRYEVVAYLHCGEAEARLIAEDLGTELRYGSASNEGTDCPNNCRHADYWK